MKRNKIIETRKLKRFIKKNYDKSTILEIYENWVEPPSWHMTWLRSKSYNFIIKFFINECRYTNRDVMFIINYFNKIKKMNVDLL